LGFMKELTDGFLGGYFIFSQFFWKPWLYIIIEYLNFLITVIIYESWVFVFWITVIMNSDTRNDTQWGFGAVSNNSSTLVYISTTLLANLLQICSPSPTHQHCNFQTTFKLTKTLHNSACQIIHSTFSWSSFF
jgi:hypothetical protein